MVICIVCVCVDDVMCVCVYVHVHVCTEFSDKVLDNWSWREQFLWQRQFGCRISLILKSEIESL